MRLFTIYSDSTEHLLSKFLRPSVPNGWEYRGFKLPESVTSQTGLDFAAALGRWGYNWIANNLERFPGECLLFTGCDQFFVSDCEADLQSRIGDNDMLCPQDGPHTCGDFRYVRSTPKTIHAFRNWPKDSPYWWVDNPLLKTALLPYELYWSMFSQTGGMWEPDFFHPAPPKTALWIHGNGTRIKHKAALLTEYKQALASMDTVQEEREDDKTNQILARIARGEGVLLNV